MLSQGQPSLPERPFLLFGSPQSPAPRLRQGGSSTLLTRPSATPRVPVVGAPSTRRNTMASRGNCHTGRRPWAGWGLAPEASQSRSPPGSGQPVAVLGGSRSQCKHNGETSLGFLRPRVPSPHRHPHPGSPHWACACPWTSHTSPGQPVPKAHPRTQRYPPSTSYLCHETPPPHWRRPHSPLGRRRFSVLRV